MPKLNLQHEEPIANDNDASVATQSYSLIHNLLIPETSSEISRVRSLNEEDQAMVAQMSNLGLTNEMLLASDSRDEFGESYFVVFRKLLEEYGETAQEAVNTLAELTFSQIFGMSFGRLRLSEVRQLKLDWHMAALMEFKDYGLTIPMLLACQTPDVNIFSLNRWRALSWLFHHQRLPFWATLESRFQMALALIKDLSDFQVFGISEGLTLDEIASFDAPWCTDEDLLAFRSFKQYGVTIEMLFSHHLKTSELTDHHTEALSLLFAAGASATVAFSLIEGVKKDAVIEKIGACIPKVQTNHVEDEVKPMESMSALLCR